MRILLSRWTEPCDGNDAQTIELTPDDEKRIEALIDWLKTHAGDEYGHTLCSWELLATKATGKADLVGIDAVLNWIAINSRYNETDTPGDYYGGNTHPDMDGRPT